MLDTSKASLAIAKCGQKVTAITDKGEIESYAVIQPYRYSYKSYANEQYEKIGEINNKNFLYIGQPNLRLDQCPADTIINTKTDSYILKRSEKIYYKDKINYIWAILELFID